jgi:hypothetical protein
MINGYENEGLEPVSEVQNTEDNDIEFPDVIGWLPPTLAQHIAIDLYPRSASVGVVEEASEKSESNVKTIMLPGKPLSERRPHRSPRKTSM